MPTLAEYARYSNQIRYRTARVLYNSYLKSKEPDLKSTLAIRILEEAVSSTEDYLMWLTALFNRESIKDDVVHFLLQCGTTKTSRDLMEKALLTCTEFETINDLMFRLKMPPLEIITRITKHETIKVEKRLTRILRASRFVKAIRIDRKSLFLSLRNRIKHGVLIYSDGSFKNVVSIKNGSVQVEDLKISTLTTKENLEIVIKQIFQISFAIQSIILILLELQIYEVRLSEKKIN